MVTETETDSLGQAAHGNAGLDPKAYTMNSAHNTQAHLGRLRVRATLTAVPLP